MCPRCSGVRAVRWHIGEWLAGGWRATSVVTSTARTFRCGTGISAIWIARPKFLFNGKNCLMWMEITAATVVVFIVLVRLVVHWFERPTTTHAPVELNCRGRVDDDPALPTVTIDVAR